MLLGYGIAAAVIIVLLVVFNIRASSRGSRAPDPGNDAAEQNGQIEPAVAEPAAPEMVPQDTGMGDVSYRGALRQFQKQQPSGEPRPSGRKTSMSDEDYRSALRNQKRGTEDKD